MQDLPQTSQRSFKHGVWYVFNLENDTIRMWLSSFSGKEVIYFNDEVIVEAKSLTKTKVRHNFQRPDGVSYGVDLRLKLNGTRATTICTLFENNVQIKQIQLKPVDGQRRRMRLIIYPAFITYVFIAILINLYDLPALLYLVPIVIAGGIILYQSKDRKPFMIFEDTTEFLED